MPNAALAMLLSTLDPETSYSYETELTRFVNSETCDLRNLRTILDDAAQADEIRYGAFYALTIAYRHRKDWDDLRDLMASHGPAFDTHPTYPHLQALCLKSSSKKLHQAAECAKVAAGRVDLRNHPGVQHNYAETLLQVQENARSVDSGRLQEIEDVLDRVIEASDGYPKYYVTKARLLSLRGYYPDAREAIDLAIEREDSESEDYSLRVGDYQLMKMDIQFKEFSRQMHDQQTHMLRSIDELRPQMIELLGLLTAVIAFFVTGIQIVGHQPYRDAARLMLTITGSLGLLYASLGVAFHGLRSWQRSAFVFAVGAALVVAPLAYWPIR